MLKLNINEDTAVSANTDIPFELVDNTNNRLSYEDGVITFLLPGQYRIEGNVMVSNVASGNIMLHIMNGSAYIADAVTGDTSSAVTDLITLPVSKTFEIERLDDEVEHAQSSIQLTAAATIKAAAIAVTYIQ